MGIYTTQNITLIWKLLTNAKNLLTKKFQAKKCSKLEFVFFYITNLQMFLANNFFWMHFFPIIYTDLDQREILCILDTHMLKKNKKIFGVFEYIYEHNLEIIECIAYPPEMA